MEPIAGTEILKDSVVFGREPSWERTPPLYGQSLHKLFRIQLLPPASWEGVPPCPGQIPGRGGGGTSYWSSIACTCYLAGSVPLAFTQEDFLVYIVFSFETTLLNFLCKIFSETWNFGLCNAWTVKKILKCAELCTCCFLLIYHLQCRLNRIK